MTGRFTMLKTVILWSYTQGWNADIPYHERKSCASRPSQCSQQIHWALQGYASQLQTVFFNCSSVLHNLGIEVTDSLCNSLRSARRAAGGECGVD